MIVARGCEACGTAYVGQSDIYNTNNERSEQVSIDSGRQLRQITSLLAKMLSCRRTADVVAAECGCRTIHLPDTACRPAPSGVSGHSVISTISGRRCKSQSGRTTSDGQFTLLNGLCGGSCMHGISDYKTVPAYDLTSRHSFCLIHRHTNGSEVTIPESVTVLTAKLPSDCTHGCTGAYSGSPLRPRCRSKSGLRVFLTPPPGGVTHLSMKASAESACTGRSSDAMSSSASTMLPVNG